MTTIDLASAPDRREELIRLNDSTWPVFLQNGDIRGWLSLYDTFAEFQLLYVERGALVGAGLTIPLAWEPGSPTPETLDEVVYRARWPLERERGVLCALGALVVPEYRRRGLSRKILQGMCELAARKGLGGLLAPVRPTQKHKYPFESIEEYANRRDDAGRVLDPWLRVHEEHGGRRLDVVRRSLTVRGTVKDWERWTGETFPRSGEYAVPDALVPVVIDRDRDVGEYVEPNIWYFHAAVAGA